MRHRARSRKLGRTSAHRKAMYRNMVTSLLQHERIETTDAKAKEVRRIAERMITLGKRGDLHARRQALRVIRSREVAAKVFDDLAERYRKRAGGYTRVLKLRIRPGDAAALSLVELIEDAAPAGAAPEATGRKESKGGTPAEKKKAASKKSTATTSAKKKKSASKKPSARKSGSKAASKKPSFGKPASKKRSTQKKTGKKSGG